MKALIIEDNYESRELFGFQIQSFGYEVTSCSDAEHALVAYRQACYQLIILDLGLPGMDGWEFCRRIGALPGRDRTMVLVITAYDSMDDLQAALDAGADDYLVKPVSWEHLRMRIRIIEQQFQNRIRRKQAEEALREREETARALLNAPTDAVVLMNPQGIVLEVNRPTACQLGTSIEHLIGSSFWKAFPSDFTERTKKRVERVIRTGEVFRGDDRWQDRWYDIVMYPLFDLKGSVTRLAMVARNITDRKRAEDKRSHHREQLEQLVRERTAAVTNLSKQLKHEMTERKRIEQALRLNDAQHQFLTRHAAHDLAIRQNGTEGEADARFGDIIGKSRAMQQIYELILRASTSDFTVMVYGESGTGKELVARTIHERSDRKHKPFVAVNCGAIPENLFESEFFGHKKGSFTGAYKDQQGYFDLAHQGTLFLDEVGELRPTMQVKLLRALEDGEYMPVGDNTCKNADVRIIAATNSDLKEQVKQGLFRQDFFYRIQVITINIPPLRERREDIPLLIEFFLEHYGNGNYRPMMSGQLMGVLCQYAWPGNVRELQNVLQCYLTTHRLEFSGGHTSEQIEQFPDLVAPIQTTSTLREALGIFEKHFIRATLDQHHGHREKTANTLGVPTRTLHRKIKKYQLADSLSNL